MTKKELIEKIEKVGENTQPNTNANLLILYALEIVKRINNVDNFELDGLEKTLLGGAPNWVRYSMGGNSLVANWEIKERIKPYLEKLGKLEDEETNNKLIIIQGDILEIAYNAIIKTIVAQN